MSCSCNNKDLDICDKPKVSAQQLDMLRSMIKCLCKCRDAPSCTATLESCAVLEVPPRLIPIEIN